MKEQILIIDDSRTERAVLKQKLESTYDICEVGNGAEALEFLEENDNKIVAVLLDLIMPVMDGYEFLSHISGVARYSNLPIVVMTGMQDKCDEVKALRLGAWDFVRKPCDKEVLLSRLHNVIVRSQFKSYQELKYLAEYDVLTGLYNKNFFLAQMKILLEEQKEDFLLIRFDIDRFQLINSFFGREEGDKLLKYIAEKIHALSAVTANCICSRVEADVFAICLPLSFKEEILEKIEETKEGIRNYELDFNITLTFGLYEITDRSKDVNTIYDCATLAARQVKGNYMKNCAVYSENMGEKLAKEQEIVNEMKEALEQEQFVVYLQPKYDVKTNKPSGSEALVRWKHPEKGMISPGIFIPVFERNGFITKLDHYMWEKVCQIIRHWIDNDIPILPVSVNISRVNLYDPRLVDILCGLTKRYNIPRELLQLELTESIYTESPDVINKTVNILREKGFTILMDDFGSGYSSLNALKDINVDILKIDMGFFEESAIPGRGENIVASVMRMAKWLDLPTIAEGVESAEQVDFLREIGCEHIQGYFYAKPMPVEEYEELIQKDGIFKYDKKEKYFDVDSLWQNNPQMQLVFDSVEQAVAIFQVDGDDVEILQANRGYDDLFGYNEREFALYNPLHIIREDFRPRVEETLNYVAHTKESAECEYLRITKGEDYRWIQMKLKYMDSFQGKTIMLGTLTDISEQREIEDELKKYRSVIDSSVGTAATVLVVDDYEMNRVILDEMLQEQHHIITAENGQEALKVMEEKGEEIDVILLDLEMPVMSGQEFLRKKNEKDVWAGIPVVIISADGSAQQQETTMNMGVEDYIVKPFVKEIVLKRVENALRSSKRLGSILKGVGGDGTVEE